MLLLQRFDPDVVVVFTLIGIPVIAELIGSSMSSRGTCVT